MSRVLFRRADERDAAAVGVLHADCWRETYAGLVPPAALAAASADTRRAMWAAALADPAAHGDAALFVAEADGNPVGFGACGSQHDASLTALGYGTEIWALYVRRSHQRLGAGRTLVALMARELAARGTSGVALWVLRANRPARDFYERLGGVRIGSRNERQGGVQLHEVAYGWADTTDLASPG